jgi:hypothetical protein
MRKKAALKSCFIAAPIAVNIRPLREALADRGIHVKDALSLLPGPGSIIGAIESAIRGVDFVCAVVSPRMSSNVMFEIGLAYGARKPLFLVVDKEADLPANLKDIFYVRASPWDSEAIEFNLDNFLEHPTRGIPRRQRTTEGKSEPSLPDGFEIDEKLESLRSLQGLERAVALEDLVTGLLEQVDAVVTQERYSPDTGADMAIWLDGIESILGNPVLVEVKAGRLSEQRLQQAELELQHYLTQTNARAGLLIYLDQTGRRFPSSPSTWPLVVRFDVRDFVDVVARGELVAALIAERNKAAHGRV